MKQTKQIDSQELPVPISETATNGTLSSTDAAKAELAADRRRREEEGAVALEEWAKKYRLALTSVTVITGNQVESRIQITALD